MVTLKMSNSKIYTFEQLCIRGESGYTCDVGSMFIPTDPASFDDVVFKIISKIDTSLLLLETHHGEVENFSFVAIPLSNQSQDRNKNTSWWNQGASKGHSKDNSFEFSAVQNVWENLEQRGWHGLQSVALLHPDSLPNNGSRIHSLIQFTNSVVDIIRANYMFQKPKESFVSELAEVFAREDEDLENINQVVIGLLWKRSNAYITQSAKYSYSVRPKIRNTSVFSPPSPVVLPASPLLSPPKKQKVSSVSSIQRRVENIRKTSASTREQPLQIQEDSTSSNEEEMQDVEEEITFKNFPQISLNERVNDPVVKENIRTAPKSPPRITPPRTTPPKASRPARSNEEVLTPAPASELDVSLSFERSTPKAGRKSMGRKSLSSDWPEDEKLQILTLFDDLNPALSEQTRIALTCKYVGLQLDKDLPSKLLYQWVQKKGRDIHTTISSFHIPETQQKEVVLKFFRDLNESSSESTRIAFTLKYIDAQYGLNITSKQLYSWLNEKTKKTPKKR